MIGSIAALPPGSVSCLSLRLSVLQTWTPTKQPQQAFTRDSQGLDQTLAVIENLLLLLLLLLLFHRRLFNH